MLARPIQDVWVSHKLSISVSRFSGNENDDAMHRRPKWAFSLIAVIDRIPAGQARLVFT